MYDLRIPIVGTVLTAPERRITEKTGTVVASFRIVMNYRRFDKATQQWTDHGMFRVRVTCWRRLADHVCSSVKVGEQVIVVGRIFTREWHAETGELRVNFEVEADSVGHDLARGTSAFTKAPVVGPSSSVEDEESESRVGGELSYPIGPDGLPLVHDPADGSDLAIETAADAMAIMRGGGLTSPDPDSPLPDDADGEEEDELVGAGARRRRGR
jgi:single-strand DNA-binding protein